MYLARPRFRSSYGAPFTADEAADWRTVHSGEFWVDPKGYVFIILGRFGLQSYRDPKAQSVSQLWATDRADTVDELQKISNLLAKAGRQATADEVKQVGDGVAVFSSGVPNLPTAPSAAPAYAPTLSQPPAPAGGKKRKRRKPKKLPLYRQTWFPFAVGGVALLLLGGVILAKRRKALPGPTA
jgi:LPXTG-motif cell wall-anchored protein